MPEIVEVSLTDLLVDPRNARLKEEHESQSSAILAIAHQQGRKLTNIARDIVSNGMNPLVLPGIVPTGDPRKRYIVIEGNRRVTALKALETPALVQPAYSSNQNATWLRLAEAFAENPVDRLRCVLFESEEELAHWVRLLHTGENEGIGLVSWGADEQDRYEGRYSKRSPAGQVLDFVEGFGGLSAAAGASNKGIITSLKRLLNTPEVREALGIEMSRGQVSTWFPRKEVAKGLTKIVEDLKTNQVKVGDIYYVDDRVDYAKRLPTAFLPDPKTRLDAPKGLSNADDPRAAPKPEPRSRRKKPRKPRDVTRTTLIPSTCQLEISPPRINLIYGELQTLSADQYPNATAVSMRVFVELSVDHYLAKEKLMPDPQLRSAPLALRMKTAAKDLRQKKRITPQLKHVIESIADGGRSLLAASLPTMHQYVHNEASFPKAGELRLAWDELQPFLEGLWPPIDGSATLA